MKENKLYTTSEEDENFLNNLKCISEKEAQLLVGSFINNHKEGWTNDKPVSMHEAFITGKTVTKQPEINDQGLDTFFYEGIYGE